MERQRCWLQSRVPPRLNPGGKGAKEGPIPGASYPVCSTVSSPELATLGGVRLSLWLSNLLLPRSPETRLVSNAHHSKKTEQTPLVPSQHLSNRLPPYFWLSTVPQPKHFPLQGQNEWDSSNFKIKTQPMKQWTALRSFNEGQVLLHIHSWSGVVHCSGRTMV